jgi:hypothetical protein
MKYLVDVLYPDAEVITVVHDQLNTHVPCALYETFEPTEARRILDKLEFHYTPKLGKNNEIENPLILIGNLLLLMLVLSSSVFTHQFRLDTLVEFLALSHQLSRIFL